MITLRQDLPISVLVTKNDFSEFSPNGIPGVKELSLLSGCTCAKNSSTPSGINFSSGANHTTGAHCFIKRSTETMK